MFHSLRPAIALFFLVSWSCPGLLAQTPKTEPDVVVFPNGEKLVGHFESFIGGAAKFKSDTLGEVTIDLSKVQELHTSQKFAVVRKNLKLAKGHKDGQVPVGTLVVENKTVQVDTGNGQPVQTVPVADLTGIIDQPSFDKAFMPTGIFQKWGGAITVGSSIVEATQNSVSFDTAIHLVRVIPTESWLPPTTG